MNPNQQRPKRPMMDVSSPVRKAMAPVSGTVHKTSSLVRLRMRLAQKKLGAKLFRFLLILGILLVAGLPSWYFYNKSQQVERRLNDPNTANKEVIDEVVKKAGHHILLPLGEQPTLATISDVSKVKGQPFFQNAENGDKILVYTQSRKAYLYRPSSDLIIEVAPLNVDSINSATSGQ